MSNERSGSELGNAERVWELHRREAGSAPRGLDLERILGAAIAIADEKGVSELSMATIARKLGYSTMALYRHVPSKADLLEAMVDTAIGPPPTDIHERSGWREQLIAWSMAIAAAYRCHQWVFDVPIAGPPLMPNAVRWMEAGLVILQQTGLSADELVGLLTTITSYLRGNEQLLAEIMRHGALGQAGAEAETYGRMLARLIPKGELPVLESIVEAGIFDVDIGVSMIEEHEMDLLFGLERFLDGIEMLIQGRDSGTRT